jgi:hypothetical protein
MNARSGAPVPFEHVASTASSTSSPVTCVPAKALDRACAIAWALGAADAVCSSSISSCSWSDAGSAGRWTASRGGVRWGVEIVRVFAPPQPAATKTRTSSGRGAFASL